MSRPTPSLLEWTQVSLTVLWSLSPVEAHKELVPSPLAPRQPGWLKPERLPELEGEVSHQMLHCPANTNPLQPQRFRNNAVLLQHSTSHYSNSFHKQLGLTFILPMRGELFFFFFCKYRELTIAPLKLQGVCFLIKLNIKLKTMETGNTARTVNVMGFDSRCVSVPFRLPSRIT